MPSSPSQYEAYLTPAARQMLSDLESDVREQILAGAAALSIQATGDLREISLGDLARSYTRFRGEAPAGRRSSVRRLLELYQKSGYIIAAASVGAVVGFKVDVARLMPGLNTPEGYFVIGASGLLIALLSQFALRTNLIERLLPRSARLGIVADKDVHAGRFLARWAALEFTLRSLAAGQLGESAAGASLHATTESLVRAGLLKSTDRRDVLALLQLRNAVAHGREFPPTDVLQEAIRQIDGLNERLASDGTVGYVTQ